MGIKSELHEAILKRGGKVPPYGGIAAAMDELNKLPGGGGDCDWNIMKNKPFYEEVVDGYVLHSTRLSFDNEEGAAIISPLGLVDGATYTVKWNIPAVSSVEYKCVAIEDEGAIVLGNIGVMSGGADTGEPFIVMESPSEGYAAVIALDGSSHAYVEITGPVEKVTHISDKYLNGNLTKYVDFETTDSVTGAISTETSSFEIYALVMTGKNVVARLSAPSVGNIGFLQLTTCSVDSCSFCGITSANLERAAVSLITVNEHDATLSQFNIAHTDT